MSRFGCRRCDWSPDPEGSFGPGRVQLADHAVEAEHPLCVVCFHSLELLEQQTCAGCVAVVRQHLAEVVELYALLPEILGELRGASLDPPTSGSDEVSLPGGDALVMLAGGALGPSGLFTPWRWVERWACRRCGVADIEDRAAHMLDVHRSTAWTEAAEWFDPAEGRWVEVAPPLEVPGDPESVAFELSRWEDDVRLTRGEPRAMGPATVAGAEGYLGGARLTWMAAHHLAFDEFAADVQKLASRLRTVTGMVLSTVRGVPCLTCGATLEREYRDRRLGHGCMGHWDRCSYPYRPHGCTDSGGLADDWTCPRCHRVYSQEDYRRAVAQRHALAQNGLVSAETIEETLGVKQGQLRVWATRGKVSRRGRDKRGRTLYDAAEVRRHAESVGILPVTDPVCNSSCG